MAWDICISQQDAARTVSCRHGLVGRVALGCGLAACRGRRSPFKRIAQRCGFGSEETMRRSFLRLVTVTPQDYRSRFTF
jgi:AraC-like DNA-binding protein